MIWREWIWDFFESMIVVIVFGLILSYFLNDCECELIRFFVNDQCLDIMYLCFFAYDSILSFLLNC